jgi:hypothetical protein
VQFDVAPAQAVPESWNVVLPLARPPVRSASLRRSFDLLSSSRPVRPADLL